MPKPKVNVPAEELRALVTEIFTSAGMDPDGAATMADTFVWANLRGVDSHGVSRVPRYLELFESGEADPRADLTTTRVAAAALLIDAHRAPGPVALTAAMHAAIGLARETGVAWVSVRGTTLTGAIGYYTKLAADAGLVGIGIVAGMPNMPYTGSRAASVATSPLSISLPVAGQDALVLDMATAGMALGKIAQYRVAGEQLPPGAAVTADGVPTTDPAEAKMPVPLGGAKGSGLSLTFELLTSVLAGNAILAPYHEDAPDGRKHRQNASLIALDPAAFLPDDEFAAAAAQTIAAIKSLPRADEEAEILYPGERGGETAAARGRDGIPIAQKAWKDLTEAAERLGVAVPAVEVPAG